MQAPPWTGDPYDFVPATQTNPGTSGVRVAWDSMRTFWGGVVNEAWWDLEIVQQSGVVLV